MKFDTITVLNIIIVAVLLLPVIVFMIKTKHFRKRCDNKTMMIIEHIGGIACILLMIFPFTKQEFGFPSVANLLAYIFINGFGLVLYVVLYAVHVKRPKAILNMVLAVIPVALFTVCGITLNHYMLVFAAVLYGIGHIYTSAADSKNMYSEAKKSEKTERRAEKENSAHKTENA